MPTYNKERDLQVGEPVRLPLGLFGSMLLAGLRYPMNDEDNASEVEPTDAAARFEK